MWWDRWCCGIAVNTVGTILEAARLVRQASSQAGWQMTDSLTGQKSHIHCSIRCSIHQSMYAVHAPSMPHRYAHPPLAEIRPSESRPPNPICATCQRLHYMQPAYDFTVSNGSLVTKAHSLQPRCHKEGITSRRPDRSWNTD